MTRPSDLTPEERDLAARLARVGGADGPSPALDAAILAAARAATAAPESAPPAGGDGKVVPLRRPAPKWPLGLGLAASLVLAVGIGWKVGTSEHGTGPALAAAEADVAAADAAAAPAADAPMEAVMLPPRNDPSPPPPPPLEEATAPARVRDDAVDARAIAQGALAAPEAQPVAPPEDAPSAVAREAVAPPAPMSAPPAPAAPSAPPPPSAAKASNDAAAGNALDRVTVTGSRVQRSSTDAAPAPTMQIGREEAFDEAPPVSADSPEVREAWLKRIRALNAAGKADEARASLREFMRRHPDAERPDDLRKLAATLPAD